MRTLVFGICFLVTFEINYAAEPTPALSSGGMIRTSFFGQTKAKDRMVGLDFVRFHIFGNPIARASYMVQFDIKDPHTPEDAAPQLSDAYASYLFSDYFILSIGNGKKPFGLEGTTNNAKRDFFEDSVLTSKWSTRDVGLWLDFHRGTLKQFRFGIYNGDSNLSPQGLESPAFAGQARFEAFPGFSVGASGYFRHLELVNLLQLGADVEYIWRFLRVAAEIAYEDSDIGTYSKTAGESGIGKTWDTYATVQLRFLGENYFGLRYEISKPDSKTKQEHHTVLASLQHRFSPATKAVMEGSYLWARDVNLGKDENYFTYRAGIQATF